ncbi:MAG: septation protein SpoVG family protein [Candidatus Eisenbacteria bacterium]|uniref:Septation protein SpoVG family protein n=1 Tax=Eiseniibacteriota bacterium TaxID=2212470 RepID=A0A956NJX3_UNCEI|nr:septation protein SpoVG family protein [Candidatus Eisenbacteria bacterium]MCB9465692.1 septation protein SpoVG family protein [Candidatus Eisenbacteria bacterium]
MLANVTKVNVILESDPKVKATVSIQMDGVFLVRGIEVIGPDGDLRVKFPDTASSTFEDPSRKVHEHLTELILAEYHKKVAEESGQDRSPDRSEGDRAEP